jgi:hypothetical protein
MFQLGATSRSAPDAAGREHQLDLAGMPSILALADEVIE